MDAKFIIMSFPTLNESEFIPVKWLVNQQERSILTDLIEKHGCTSVFWPPLKTPSAMSKAQQEEIKPSDNWKIYEGQVLSVAATILEAREKVAISLETSNVDEVYQSEKRKRKQKVFYDDDEAECESDGERSKKVTKKVKETLTKPKPPKPVFQKAVVSTIVAEKQPMRHAEQYEEVSINAVVEREELENHRRSVQHEGFSQTPERSAHRSAALSHSEGSTALILEKLFVGLQEVKQTQKLQSHLLQTILVKLNGSTASVTELPQGLDFPVKTIEELLTTDRKITDDLDAQRVLKTVATSICIKNCTGHKTIQLLIEIGGSTVKDFVRKNMKFLIGDNVARKLNLTGQKEKTAFKELTLFNVLFSAMRQNMVTKDGSRKEMEMELATWFVNSRDRGSGRRLHQPKPSASASETSASSSLEQEQEQ